MAELKDRGPRVLMVVRLFHPWVGGTERQALKLSKAMRAAGTPVVVVTGRWFRGTSRAETIEGVPVVRHHTLWEFFGIRGLRKLGGYLYMITLAWYLVRNRRHYDLIHVHGLNYHTAVAAAVGRRLGKPTVVKLANSGSASDIDRMREGRQLAGAGLFLGAALRCDRFVALSPAIGEELRRAGVAEDRIVAIPNGVEVDTVVAAPTPEPGRLRVVYLGRLHRQKGVDVLLEALRVLTARRACRVSVRIVGDGPERESLETAVTTRGLDHAVEFVGEVEDPGPMLDEADVFVLPSRTEGMSNALLEAMARATAVVATAVPGTARVVEDRRTGLLVAPEDPVGLADALERLAQRPEEVHRLGEAAVQEIRAHYSMGEVAQRYAALYASLLEPARASLVSEGGRR